MIKNISICFFLLFFAPVKAEQLGFLFTTPLQREVLNALREKHKNGLYIENNENVKAPIYKFHGFVSKNKKMKKLWVNDQAINTTGSVLNVKKEQNIDLPVGRVSIKPGQIYQSSHARIIEGFHVNTVNKDE